MLKDLPHVVDTVARIMQQPVPWLPLPAEWDMGTHLAIDVEAQYGPAWDRLEPYAL